MRTDWEKLDWKRLAALRQRFLEAPAGTDYWQSSEDLAVYDETFAERIGWKWDAVLGELRLRGWKPAAPRLVDWGCGTGIAARRMLSAFPDAAWERITLWDRSSMAKAFAAEGVSRTCATARVVTPFSEADAFAAFDGAVVLLSHVANELSPAARDELVNALSRAAAIVWVEPGTWQHSGMIVEARERLRGSFTVVAPCTHSNACGMLAEANRRHWCHHFAHPPTEAFMNAGWTRFGQILGIDLRALPYSFICFAAHVTEPAQPEGRSRVIGRCVERKGLMEVLACSADGVQVLELWERDNKPVIKLLRKQPGIPVFRWQSNGPRVAPGAEAISLG